MCHTRPKLPKSRLCTPCKNPGEKGFVHCNTTPSILGIVYSVAFRIHPLRQLSRCPLTPDGSLHRGFTAFDIATQSLVASYMGAGDPAQARQVLLRVLQLGVGVGSVLAVAVVVGAGAAPAAFTQDGRIISAAQAVFPLLGMLLVRVCVRDVRRSHLATP